MSKVYFFYGDNVYSLRNKVNRRKTEFALKFGSDSIFHFTNQNRDQAIIRQALFGSGLFVSQKMVVLEGVPRDTAPGNILSENHIEVFFSEFMTNFSFLDADTLVVFVSYAPDKRTKYFKRLSTQLVSKNVQDFPLLKLGELKLFIKEQLGSLSMDDLTLDYFIAFVGADLYRISSEIAKFRDLFPTGDKKITQEMVDTYCFGMVETDAFSFFDKLFVDPFSAVVILEKLQNDNSYRPQTHGLLLWGLKSYFLILEMYLSGQQDAKSIIATTKIAPYTVYKTLKQINLLIPHQDFIRQFILDLIDFDYQIKSGKMVPDLFWIKVKDKVLMLST